jgi:hypothetical protein
LQPAAPACCSPDLHRALAGAGAGKAAGSTDAPARHTVVIAIRAAARGWWSAACRCAITSAMVRDTVVTCLLYTLTLLLCNCTHRATRQPSMAANRPQALPMDSWTGRSCRLHQATVHCRGPAAGLDNTSACGESELGLQHPVSTTCWTGCTNVLPTLLTLPCAIHAGMLQRCQLSNLQQPQHLQQSKQQ